ncbi:hypothetical protein LTR53_011942, partial [Teratosphaeriaceae sp. CCFEE 6253]
MRRQIGVEYIAAGARSRGLAEKALDAHRLAMLALQADRDARLLDLARNATNQARCDPGQHHFHLELGEGTMDEAEQTRDSSVDAGLPLFRLAVPGGVP